MSIKEQSLKLKDLELQKEKKRLSKEQDKQIDSIFSNDPSHVYIRQDIQTLKSCRNVVKGIAKSNKVSVEEVANVALELAQQAQKEFNDKCARSSTYEIQLQKIKTLVTYWLLNEDGLYTLKMKKGYKIPLITRLKHNVNFDLNVSLFLASISLISLSFCYIILSILSQSSYINDNNFVQEGILIKLLIVLSSLLVGSQVGIILSNYAINYFIPPSVVPKLDFSKGIPDEHRTIVIVPTLIGSLNDVKNLLSDLTARFMVNKDKNLYFALLTDFTDSNTQTTTKDDTLLQAAVDGIEELNRQCPNENGLAPYFYLLHRPRLFNPQENKWMGWERKRGKLMNFTELLRGGPKDVFQKIVGEQYLSVLQTIKYFITLDTDTMLPSDNARKLVGTAAHIMNKPFYDKKLGKVTLGYGILQPRVDLTITGAFKSIYSYINSYDASLDQYTRYCCNAYQDAFQEGSFIGKGLIHVDEFIEMGKSVFPENRILSHDLIEGCYLRAGFVSDVELHEEYPASFHTDASRKHRWTRGDWQIASWLFPKVPSADGSLVSNPISLINKWKIFDNLRRTFVPLAMVILITYAWLSQSFNSWIPLQITLIVFNVNLITNYIGIIQYLIIYDKTEPLSKVLKDIQLSMTKRLIVLSIELITLPFEAYQNINAVITAMSRLYITKQNLLEWTASTQATRGFCFQAFLYMCKRPLIVLVLSVIVLPKNFNITFDYLTTSPLCLLTNIIAFTLLNVVWIISPIIAYFLSKPFDDKVFEPESISQLNDQEVKFLRILSRKTWRFFETFIREEDNYLPLDNYQEGSKDAKEIEVRRTSPTNIGMALLAYVSAFEFGYLTKSETLLKTFQTLNTLFKLDRYKGHFYNWYDTQTLKPLQRFVSTVDSGNLTASMTILKTFLKQQKYEPIISKNQIQGLKDTLYCAQEALNQEESDKYSDIKIDLVKQIQEIENEINQMPSFKMNEMKSFIVWMQSIQVKSSNLLEISSGCLKQIKKYSKSISNQSSWQNVSNFYINAFDKQMEALKYELMTFFPFAFAEMPVVILSCTEENITKIRNQIQELNIFQMSLNDVSKLKEKLKLPVSEITNNEELNRFLKQLEELIMKGSQNAQDRIDQLKITYSFCIVLSDQEYAFLFNNKLKLLSIGHDADNDKTLKCHYDTLCSEARLASYQAIVNGEAPVSHWFTLERKTVPHISKSALTSWTGSMFEYLMPLLIMPSQKGSILHSTYQYIVEHQIEYASKKNVPWGISECAYYEIDSISGRYCYQYNGIPSLAKSDELMDQIVIAPYAAAMALMVLPVKSTQNLNKLASIGAIGPFGLYEAVDFTSSRTKGAEYKVVPSYFSHHSGMTLLSLLYALEDKPIQKLFNKTSEYQSYIQLLQEELPNTLPSINNKEKINKYKKLIALKTQIPQPLSLKKSEQFDSGVSDSMCGTELSNFSVPDLEVYQQMVVAEAF